MKSSTKSKVDEIATQCAWGSWDEDLHGLRSPAKTWRDKPRQCDYDRLHLAVWGATDDIERYFAAKFREQAEKELIRRWKADELPNDVRDGLIEAVRHVSQ